MRAECGGFEGRKGEEERVEGFGAKKWRQRKGEEVFVDREEKGCKCHGQH
jgi:hypothetical protein